MNSIAPEPSAWQAAHERAVHIERIDLTIIRVFGRDPVRMIQGLLTNDVASLPVGGATYGALLTPKGRMLADLRAIRRAGDVLLICDTAAAANVRDTLKKYVPPLFARSGDAPDLQVLGVYGPESTRLVAGLLDPVDGESVAGTLSGIGEDRGILATAAGSEVFIVHDLDAGVPGWLLIGETGAISAAESHLEPSAERAGATTLETMRIEAGRPRWGAELGEDVIPIEAGITSRAISTEKGCYTGQEVIIRILHRGHVNRRLMGFRLGDAELPAAGTEAFRPGETRAVARITSASRSPTLRETIALGYVRREIEAGTELRAGSPEGRPALVCDLPFHP
jgi:folate-binding protein YgfZ